PLFVVVPPQPMAAIEQPTSTAVPTQLSLRRRPRAPRLNSRPNKASARLATASHSHGPEGAEGSHGISVGRAVVVTVMVAVEAVVPFMVSDVGEAVQVAFCAEPMPEQVSATTPV